MKKLIALAALCIASTSAMGQDGLPARRPWKEMNVDMPDETEETDLVGTGEFQLETAFLYNRYKQGQSSAIGQAMLRYGIRRTIEVRLLTEDGRMRDRYIEETVQSTYPMALGAKMTIIKDHSFLPDMTLVSYLKLPFTSRNREQKSYWSPIVLLAFQNKFRRKWKLEYNAGTQQEAYSKDIVWLGNASIHYQILEPLEVFAEYYGQFEPSEDPQHNLGGGLAYQLGNHLEFYVSGGSTVKYQRSNYFFAGGVAFRMP